MAILFTTLPLVWIAQAPAKYLCFWNSEKFLRHTRFSWQVLKATIWFTNLVQLNSVTELLVSPFRSRWEAQKRNLPPSDAAHYVASLKRYGYGMHEIVEEILIHKDGSTTIEQFCTMHLVSGKRDSFVRTQNCDQPWTEAEVKILDGFRCPLPGETLGDIIAQLGQRGPDHATIADLSFRNISDPKKQKEVRLEIVSPEPMTREMPPRAAVVKFHLKTKWRAKSFFVSSGAQDWTSLDCKFPYRSVQSTIRFSPECNLIFAKITKEVTFDGIPYVAEERRITQVDTGDASVLEFRIDFPLPGALYKVHWTVWDRVATQEPQFIRPHPDQEIGKDGSL
jgi:hypothetical protein